MSDLADPVRGSQYTMFLLINNYSRNFYYYLLLLFAYLDEVISLKGSVVHRRRSAQDRLWVDEGLD